MKTIFLIMSLFLVLSSDTYIREYSYLVSNDDSRNIARTKALNEIKTSTLEEVGVHVESSVELKYDTLTTQIETQTAGIIKTKILEESFNGKVLYLKVILEVDPNQVNTRRSLTKNNKTSFDVCSLEPGVTKQEVMRIAGDPTHVYFIYTRKYEKRLQDVKTFYYNNGKITINFDDFNRVNKITGCI